MALTGKKKEAAEAIAAANPGWSKRHVEMCADFLMPTSNAWCFEPGTKERKAAEELHKERMHAFLVEMNIIPADQAYTRPDDWKSPYTNPTPRAHKARSIAAPKHRAAEAVPQGVEVPADKPKPASSEIREPKPGSAGAQAWAICDAFYAQHGRIPTAAEARAAGEAAGLNPGNVGTEASRWGKFRGYRQ
jgi:hypothetical protein